MSQENVELVRTIYAHVEAGDTESAFALYHPEMEIHDRPEIPDPQVYRGREGALDALRSSESAFEELELTTEEFLDAGDQVIVVFRFRGTGRESGVPVDERLAHRWIIQDGKALRMHVHTTPEEALRAARA